MQLEEGARARAESLGRISSRFPPKHTPVSLRSHRTRRPRRRGINHRPVFIVDIYFIYRCNFFFLTFFLNLITVFFLSNLRNSTVVRVVIVECR